jgi:hypothetical protein
MSNPYSPDPSSQNPYGPTQQSGGYDPYQVPQTYPQYNQPASGPSEGYPSYPPSREGYPHYNQSSPSSYGPAASTPQNIIVNVHQGQQQYQMQPVMVAVAPPTNGKATAALVLGLLSLLFWVLTGIPAVILGHMALNEIKASNGTQGGSGSAITGLIFGYLAVGGLAICIFCYALGGLAALTAPQ